jgi:hypothetical protein
VKWVIPLVVAAFLLGCSDSVNLESRTPSENDTPFGGGFPDSHRPGGDPYGANQRHQEIRPLAPGGSQQNQDTQPRMIQPIQPMQPQQPVQPRQPYDGEFPSR